MPYHPYILFCVQENYTSRFYLDPSTLNRTQTLAKLEFINDKLDHLQNHRETSFLVQIYRLQKDICHQRLFELDLRIRLLQTLL